VILSDRSIRDALAEGRIRIEPLDEARIQPSSVDLKLDRLFRVFRNHTAGVIDVKENLEDLTELVKIPEDGVFMLHPGEFVLGSTFERVTLGVDIVGRLDGKSSLGRLGLLIHSTAGFIDPGFDGHITLELSNVASLPITLYPGMRIGQISFLNMTTAADHPYGSGPLGSKYQGQRGPTPSRYHENFRPG
jgi:dCTP deaminase